MINTKGVAGDYPELMNYIDALKKIKADLETYSANGSYDLSGGALKETSIKLDQGF